MMVSRIADHRFLRRCLSRRVAGSVLLVFAGTLCGACLAIAQTPVKPAAAQTPAKSTAPQAAFDPRALQLLEEMAEAYARLPALNQESVFFSSLTPIPPPGVTPSAAETPRPSASAGDSGAAPDIDASETKDRDDGRRLTLLIERPNKLRMELRQNDPKTGKPTVAQWVSDGKTFWTYNPEHNGYTREKAPAQLHDFLKLPALNSGSLELLMTLGLDPFTDLQNKVDSARYDGTAVVRGVPTDVVTLQVASRTEATQSRFYIGKDDRLLRRLVTETTPVFSPTPSGRVGDPLDELLDDSPPPGPSPAASPDDPNGDSGTVSAVKTRIAYDNILVARPAFGSQAFAFLVPTGALLYQTIDLNGSAHKITPKEYLRDLIKSIKSQHRQQQPKTAQPIGS